MPLQINHVTCVASAAPKKTIDNHILIFSWYVTLLGSGEGEAFAAISAESRMQGTVRRVTIASALSNAEGALGTWAMSLQGFLAEVCVLCVPSATLVFGRPLERFGERSSSADVPADLSLGQSVSHLEPELLTLLLCVPRSQVNDLHNWSQVLRRLYEYHPLVLI